MEDSSCKMSYANEVVSSALIATLDEFSKGTREAAVHGFRIKWQQEAETTFHKNLQILDY